MDQKRDEYSSDNDRLQNFREVAEFLGQRPAEVSLAYLLKHIQSITLAVRTGEYAWKWKTDHGEGLKQRIADARNYLLLLAACLEEETEKVVLRMGLRVGDRVEVNYPVDDFPVWDDFCWKERKL